MVRETGLRTDPEPPKPLSPGREAILKPGDVLAGRYEIRSRIGAGGMGAVYRAFDRELREDVALKLLAKDRTADPLSIERFRREVKIARQLSHPSVCRVFELGEADGHRFLTMELVEGRSLRAVLEEERLGPGTALTFLQQISEGVAHAHAQAVIHRDLKPENVMITDEGRAIVVDFGLARSVSAAGSIATISGTPAYMSPEQLRGLPFDQRSDVFALGILGHELLTGTSPFGDGSPEEVAGRILNREPMPLDVSDLAPAVVSALSALLRRALAKDPKERFPNAEAFAAALWEAIEGVTRARRKVQTPVEIGEVIAGKYRVERVLGQGGMGYVVAARHLHLDETVAIKLLLPEIGRNKTMVERFLREARAAAKIKSEHVARVTDVDLLGGAVPFMVLEYLEGSDLDAVVAAGPLPVRLAVDYVTQACHALAEAHGLGIVHRDLKPSNLFLTKRRDGTECVKVFDFGISKLLASSDGKPIETFTSSGVIMGSPKYMSPEQLLNSRAVDARTDIWSLGVILYRLLTGTLPFRATTANQLVDLVLHTSPRRPSELRPEVPPAIDDVVLTCLARHPERRYADAGELRAALMRVMLGPWLAYTKTLPLVPPEAAAAARALAANPAPLPVVPVSRVEQAIPPGLPIPGPPDSVTRPEPAVTAGRAVADADSAEGVVDVLGPTSPVMSTRSRAAGSPVVQRQAPSAMAAAAAELGPRFKVTITEASSPSTPSSFVSTRPRPRSLNVGLTLATLSLGVVLGAFALRSLRAAPAPAAPSAPASVTPPSASLPPGDPPEATSPAPSVEAIDDGAAASGPQPLPPAESATNARDAVVAPSSSTTASPRHAARPSVRAPAPARTAQASAPRPAPAPVSDPFGGQRK